MATDPAFASEGASLVCDARELPNVHRGIEPNELEQGIIRGNSREQQATPLCREALLPPKKCGIRQGSGAARLYASTHHPHCHMPDRIAFKQMGEFGKTADYSNQRDRQE